MNMARPAWCFRLYCHGRGDEICATDYNLAISSRRRVVWRIRGALLTRLFGWWHWAN
jgi:hypothetical protein